MIVLSCLFLLAQIAPTPAIQHRMHTQPLVIESDDHKYFAQIDVKSVDSLAILNVEWSAMPQDFKDKVLGAEKQAWGRLPAHFGYILKSAVKDETGRIMCGPFSPMPCQTSGIRKGCGCAPQADKDKLEREYHSCNGPPESCK